MKLVLISDIHLGVKNSNERFLENSKQFFLKDVCDVIEKENASYLLILGDLFDNRLNINVLVKHTAIEIFKHILKKFPTLQIKILAGNHDIYYKNTLEVSSINIFKKFDPRVEIITEAKGIDFDGYKAAVFPWIVEGSRTEKAFKRHVEKVREDPSKKIPLCLGHFHINGFEIVKGVIEDKGISQEDFSVFDHVFSGHFHIRNKIGNMQYLGCPYEITWNDYKDVKGITVFDTITQEQSFYENTSSPKHVAIKISNIENDSEIEQLAKNNFVRLIIDKPLDASKKQEYIELVEKASIECNTLDEEIHNIDDTKVEMNNLEDIVSPVAFLSSYCDEIEKPEYIEPNKLKTFINELYNRSIRDESS